MSGLGGRHVLVVGGSGGIGAAVVETLVEGGASVHVLSRDPSALAPAARASAGDVWPVDLADDAEVWAALDALTERLDGAPDALVSSAGAFALSPLAETSVDAFDRHVSVNLRGPFLVLRALLPAFLERGSGHIVLVGSIAGRRGFSENGAYGASKFGLRGLHEVLLEELRGTGVAATLLEPGATDTPLWDEVDPDGRPDLPDRARMLRPSDVAAAVRFVLTRPSHVRVPLMQIERG